MKNCKIRALKIRGVYNTIEEAKERCQAIQEYDKDFSIYIAEVGAWVPWSDDDKYSKDIEYQNEELNKLMKNYKKNQIKAKEYHEQRKNDLIEKNIKENDELKKKNELDEKNKLEPEPEVLEPEDIENKINEDTNKIKKETDELKNTQEESKNIKDELEKAKKLYEKLTSEKLTSE